MNDYGVKNNHRQQEQMSKYKQHEKGGGGGKKKLDRKEKYNHNEKELEKTERGLKLARGIEIIRTD